MLDKRDEILDIVQPILDASGFELVDLTISVAKKPVIRIYVYRADGVTVDDCADISRAVEFEFDSVDLFNRRYCLEVSSPGLDRPLKTERDFRRNIGNQVRLFLNRQENMKQELNGVIKECSASGLTLSLKEQDAFLEWDNILKGKLVY
ncbi:MAG: ribosome maturation factor RimP [candidate division Zixibacteria bacterium]|nr:ribosome maturation factor RimP [candidate division Zixibacteria bacterium]